jgi:hypothetical protein
LAAFVAQHRAKLLLDQGDAEGARAQAERALEIRLRHATTAEDPGVASSRQVLAAALSCRK